MPVHSPDDTRPRHRHEHKSRRSRSPDSRDYRSSHHRRQRTPPVAPITLPFNAKHLSKNDFRSYMPLFASYLNIQKSLNISGLDDAEVKGRWKSFVGKWNRRELAEGWYDPTTLRKAVTSPLSPSFRETSTNNVPNAPTQSEDQDAGSDSDIGPPLPSTRASRPGPAIPTTDDLALQRDAESEAAASARHALHLERRAHNATEKARLEEIAPRAEPGTRERQLEKKAALASSNRAFADSKDGDLPEVGERELMGGEEDDVASYKRQRAEMERKKGEREVKREENMRARREEREERIREFREREERTMGRFLEMARARFGGGGGSEG